METRKSDIDFQPNIEHGQIIMLCNYIMKAILTGDLHYKAFCKVGALMRVAYRPFFFTDRLLKSLWLTDPVKSLDHK